jgi:hypothetical protein
MTRVEVPDEIVTAIANDAMNRCLRDVLIPLNLLDPTISESRSDDIQRLQAKIVRDLVTRWRVSFINDGPG